MNKENWNGQNSTQNVFEQAARTLYGVKKQKDEEEKKLRNSLLNELGDKAQAKHVLYSSVDDLKKMKDEMNLQKFNNYKGKPTSMADSIENSNLQSLMPLVDRKEGQKAKLLDKIQTNEKLDNVNFLSKKKEKADSNYQSDEKKQETHKEDYQINSEYEQNIIDPQKPVLKSTLVFDDYQTQQESSPIQDEQFNKFLKHMYVTEGGFVDDPDDRGGRTNRGVTQRTYDAYNKKHGLELKDVKDISKEEADKIYYEEYYLKSGADKIEDPALSYMHYDAAINHGPGTAKKLLAESGGDFDKYYQGRKAIYDELNKKPKQQKFYKGWMNRINNIDKMKREGILND